MRSLRQTASTHTQQVLVNTEALYASSVSLPPSLPSLLLPHNFWQAFRHWVFIGKSDCLKPRTVSLPFIWENSMFPALPFPEETSPKSTLKTWTQIALTVYYFQAGLMILQVWLILDKCRRLVMTVSCRQRGRTSPDLSQYSFHCCCRAKSWARFAGPWPWGLSQDLLRDALVWKRGYRSVHAADSLTSTSLLRAGEHLLVPELRPGVGGSPMAVGSAAAHREHLHHGTADLHPWAQPPVAPHHCWDTTRQNHLWTLSTLRPQDARSGETGRRKGEF